MISCSNTLMIPQRLNLFHWIDLNVFTTRIVFSVRNPKNVVHLTAPSSDWAVLSRSHVPNHNDLSPLLVLNIRRLSLDSSWNAQTVDRTIICRQTAIRRIKHFCVNEEYLLSNVFRKRRMMTFIGSVTHLLTCRGSAPLMARADFHLTILQIIANFSRSGCCPALILKPERWQRGCILSPISQAE